MDDVTFTLRHQVALLREIAHRQEAEIEQISAAREQLSGELERHAIAHAHASAAAVAASGPGRGELEARIAAERAEADRLRREVLVWRRDQASGSGATHEEERQQGDARHEAERRQWEAQRSWLQTALLDIQRRGASEAEAAARRGGAAGELASAHAEAARLREELDVERRSAAFALDRAAAAQRDLEDERRACVDEERRIERESELQRAQLAQLRSAEDAVAQLRAQLRRTQQDGSELRASLAQNQEMLHCLRL